VRAALTLVGLVGGCERLDIERADADVRFVCDAPGWDALLAACREADCPGVASLRGSGGGQPFVVTSRLDTAVLRLSSVDEIEVLERIDGFGAGPYFAFAVVAKSVGQALGGPSRPFAFAFGAENLEDDLADDVLALKVRLSVPGREISIEASPGSGGLTMLRSDSPEVSLRFDGSFDGEAIEGCLATVAAEVRDR